jgi:hypothetical protein
MFRQNEGIHDYTRQHTSQILYHTNILIMQSCRYLSFRSIWDNPVRLLNSLVTSLCIQHHERGYVVMVMLITWSL